MPESSRNTAAGTGTGAGDGEADTSSMRTLPPLVVEKMTELTFWNSVVEGTEWYML